MIKKVQNKNSNENINRNRSKIVINLTIRMDICFIIFFFLFNQKIILWKQKPKLLVVSINRWFLYRTAILKPIKKIKKKGFYYNPSYLTMT